MAFSSRPASQAKFVLFDCDFHPASVDAANTPENHQAQRAAPIQYGRPVDRYFDGLVDWKNFSCGDEHAAAADMRGNSRARKPVHTVFHRQRDRIPGAAEPGAATPAWNLTPKGYGSRAHRR